jgi:hypothetical protein
VGGSMFKRIVLRALFGLFAVGSLGVAAATPALASGSANWQITFSGTGPGFGFWGWCDFAGGTTFSNGLATSGTTGDCQFAEYFHEPGVFSGTCEVSLDLMAEGGAPAWQEGPNGDWFFSGTAVTHPASQTGFCQTLPGSPPPTFSNYDSLIPVAVGHTNASGFFGTTELQIQETPLK